MRRFDYPASITSVLLARIREHVEQKTIDAPQLGADAVSRDYINSVKQSAPIPSEMQLSEILEVLFFASLTEEEGRVTQPSLTFVAPEFALQSRLYHIRFKESLMFDIESIRKVSQAIDRRTNHLGVYPSVDGSLRIWGVINSGLLTSRHSLKSLTITVLDRGTLVVRLFPEEIALYAQGTLSILGTSGSVGHLDALGMVKEILTGTAQPPLVSQKALTILQIASEIMKVGHGGTLLVIPDLSSIKGLRGTPRYLVDPDIDSPLYRAMLYLQQEQERINSQPDTEYSLAPKSDLKLEYAKDRVRTEIKNIAQLSGVDGAVVIDSDLRLHSFGAMIDFVPTEQEQYITLINPTSLVRPYPTIPVSKLSGGTRHRSAIEFCYQNPGALGFVVSQDRILTVVTKFPNEENTTVIRPFYPGTAFLFDV